MKPALFVTPLLCLYLLHFGWPGLVAAVAICAAAGRVAWDRMYPFQWAGWCWAMMTFFVVGALINL